jgi:hypothetical protein
MMGILAYGAVIDNGLSQIARAGRMWYINETENYYWIDVSDADDI